MSDRSYAQVVILDCPEDQRAAALAAICEAFECERGQLNEWPQRDTMPGSDDVMAARRWQPEPELVIGERYGTDECSLDMDDTIADAIIAAAPGATFKAWVDPKYEYDGSLRLYAPDLGLFATDADADGRPHIPSDVLVRLVDEATELDTLRADLAKITGAPWIRRAAELRAKLNQANAA